MIELLYEHFKAYPLVSTDTRNLPENCIFFALKGANFNGNQYAADALKNGAAFAVVDEAQYATEERTILVPDVLKVLQQLANYHRRQLNIPFIGITGSNGKTTTKELIREVLAQKYNVLATKGNLNNHIGVPLTLLSITREHEIAIIEMGANHVGEIKMLCDIAMPDHGLITNIGKAHIEGFGGYEGVKRAKKELYDHIMAHDGHLFVHTDDELLMGLTKAYANKTGYGRNTGELRGKLLSTIPFVSLEWEEARCGKSVVSTRIFGKYNFPNIMAAITIGHFFGIEKGQINNAISAYQPSNNRSQLIKTAHNTIYMDAYNANPSSMSMAIESFIEVDAPEKMIILGDMLELGSEAAAEHQKIVDYLKGKEVSRVLLVGPLFCQTDMTEGQLAFPSNKELCNWLRQETVEGFHILIKGSRGIQLEKAVEWIA